MSSGTFTVGTPFPLWPHGAPGALGQRPEDCPTLTAFHPEPAKRNGASLVIFPGGGYAGLADYEGEGYAEWFAARGVTCYVLHYRLGTHGYRHPSMLHDAAEAVRWVRHQARREGLDPARVGVMGSSAGGHLAAMLATRFEREGKGDGAAGESSRPDLAILCYPVITMRDPFTHTGSRDQLLGPDSSPALRDSVSAELHVTRDTSPCFIWMTAADEMVPVENALLFASALRAAAVPFALHVFENGRHGLALGHPDQPAPPWPELCLHWLRERKFL